VSSKVLTTLGFLPSQAAAFGVVTAPVWLTALLLGRAWMFLRQRWRQEADAEADGFLLPPEPLPGAILCGFASANSKQWRAYICTAGCGVARDSPVHLRTVRHIASQMQCLESVQISPMEYLQRRAPVNQPTTATWRTFQSTIGTTSPHNTPARAAVSDVLPAAVRARITI